MVVQAVWGKKKEENYFRLVYNLLKFYEEMSLKLHIKHPYVDLFKSNIKVYFEEHGEHFHQNVMRFEKSYQGQFNVRMVGD